MFCAKTRSFATGSHQGSVAGEVRVQELIPDAEQLVVSRCSGGVWAVVDTSAVANFGKQNAFGCLRMASDGVKKEEKLDAFSGSRQTRIDIDIESTSSGAIRFVIIFVLNAARLQQLYASIFWSPLMRLFLTV